MPFAIRDAAQRAARLDPAWIGALVDGARTEFRKVEQLAVIIRVGAGRVGLQGVVDAHHLRTIVPFTPPALTEDTPTIQSLVPI